MPKQWIEMNISRLVLRCFSYLFSCSIARPLSFGLRYNFLLAFCCFGPAFISMKDRRPNPETDFFQPGNLKSFADFFSFCYQLWYYYLATLAEFILRNRRAPFKDITFIIFYLNRDIWGNGNCGLMTLSYLSHISYTSRFR